MKTNLNIFECEEKTTQGGKPYTRFKTQDGWMSCFDTKECEAIRMLISKWASCEVMESPGKEGKIFHNIKKCYGKADGENITPTPQTTKVQNTGIAGKNTTMYTSYAKDIFVSLDKNEFASNKEAMMLAIDLVKQAQTAFS